MPDVSPTWIAVLPLLGGLWNGLKGFFASDVERNVARHSRLIAEIPPGTDDQPLRKLLAAEIAEVARRGDARLHRQVSGAGAAAFVFVLVMASLLTWVLWRLPDQFGWETWAEVIVRAIALAIALFGFLLLAAGWGSLFEDRRTSAENKGP